MRSLDDLAAHVPRLAEARVVCIGDIILDQFIYGVVERISPEAPIPILRVTRETATLGGVANVARNLTSLNATCTVHAVIGEDDAGRQLAELLHELPRCEHHLLAEPGRKTTIKTRCIAGSQQLVRVDRESLDDLSPLSGRRMLESIRSERAASSVLVLSDYGKGVLTRAHIPVDPGRERCRPDRHCRSQGNRLFPLSGRESRYA